MSSTVTLSRRGEDRLRAGHVWVYRSDVTHVGASGGDVVTVIGRGGRRIGTAFYSDRSEIAVRLLTRRDEPVDAGWWRTRLEEAFAYRASLDIDATAYRLVHTEADRMPSLVVDRYGEFVVIQTLSQGTERILPQLCDLLEELLSPAGILERNDRRVRELEGLERRVGVVRGQVPERLAVRQGAITFDVDPWAGQCRPWSSKTGLFLDQRENYGAAAAYARGRLLDAFSYTGGFALSLAAACEETLAVDISKTALATLTRQAADQRLAVTPRLGNAFDVLRELERAGERFDTIVLDPPAFAKNRKSVTNALTGYKEINLRALKLLAPGGMLITCSCSYHVDEASFAQILYEASLDAHAPVVVVEKRMQARDHPVVLGIPETYYLKCFIVRRLP